MVKGSFWSRVLFGQGFFGQRVLWDKGSLGQGFFGARVLGEGLGQGFLVRVWVKGSLGRVCSRILWEGFVQGFFGEGSLQGFLVKGSLQGFFARVLC